MIDFDGQASPPTDLHRFVNGLQQVIAFRAYMGDVDAPVAACHLRNLDQFPGGGVCVGRIDEGIGDAECTILHSLGHYAPHRLQFVRCGGAHLQPLCVLPQCPASQKRTDIGCDAAFDHGIEPVAQARPVSGAFGPVTDERPFLLRQIQEGIRNAPTCRRGGPTLAHDLGRDSLGDLGEGARVVHQRDVRVAEDVYEAWADHHARRFYHFTRRFRGKASGRRNLQHAIITDDYIPVVPGIACAIYDLRTADQNVNIACRHFFIPHKLCYSPGPASSRNFARMVCTCSASKGKRRRNPSSILRKSSSAGTESATGKGPVSVGKNVRNSRNSRLVWYDALAVKEEPPGKVRVRYMHSSMAATSGGRKAELFSWEVRIRLCNGRSS